MEKNAIRKTVADLGNALGFKTLQMEGHVVTIDVGEFISFAFRHNEDEKDEDSADQTDEEEEGPRKPPKKITPDLIRKVLFDLGGKATSSEIRTQLKNDHDISASAADIRPALQTLTEKEEISTSGQARALMYILPKRR